MKVTFLKPLFNIFKKKQPIITEPCRLGYSDLPSHQIRSALRTRILDRAMPYDEFYKSGRKSEYELNKMISNMVKKSNVDDEKLKHLGIWNFSKIQDNAYRGESLHQKPEHFKTLKEAGIRRVIDLAGHFRTEQACSEFGLEYKAFIVDEDNFWKQEAFQDEKSFLSRMEDYLRLHCADEKIPEALKGCKNDYNENCRAFINNFIDLTETINKGHFYIGCDLGTDKTSDILMLSQWLNPRDNQYFIQNPDAKIIYIKSLYENFTESDKKRLGYTSEFEKRLKKNIEMVMRM